MIGYTLKPLLELLPEALPFVKKANLTEDYPLDSKDACVASALCISYHANIDKQSVDPWLMEKVAHAVDLHGMTETVNNLSQTLKSRALFTKQASSVDRQAEFLTKQASFEGDLSGIRVDVEGLSKKASELYEEALSMGQEPSETVSLYSANAFLNKQAAVDSLNARFHATKDPVFVKIAVAINSNSAAPSRKTIQDLCSTVTGLDKKAGLDKMGFDFYKETLIVKSAAYSSVCRVRIGKEEFPLDAVQRIPDSYLNDYLGADFSKELKSDPNTAKAVVESLPADLQQVLLQLIKHSK